MRLIISLLLSIFVCGGVGAQDKVTGLQIRLVAQQLPKNLPEVVALAGENLSDPIVVPKNNLSERLKVPGRSLILQTVSGAEKLCKISLPEDGSDFIVLLIPGKETVFEPIVLNSKNSSFRPGDFYFLNSSKETIVGKVGTTQCQLKPGEGEVVRPEGAKQERFYDVLLGVREGKGARAISSSRWPLSKHMRTYVFFFDDAAKDNVGFRAVDEFVPAAE